MTTNREPVPVHIVLVLGTPNMFTARRKHREAFTPDALIRTPGTREYAPRFSPGRRDVEEFPLSDDQGSNGEQSGNKRWSNYCAAGFGAADTVATAAAYALADTLDIDGSTLTVVQSSDWSEHDPAHGVYCQIPARDVWSQLAEEYATLTITA